MDSGIDVKLLELTLSPIRSLLSDPDVTDILVYGSKDVFYRKRSGAFERKENTSWESDEHLTVAVNSIALRMERSLDSRDPILDARLPDKSRVNIVVDPCYNKGACIVIRRFPEQHFKLDDLVKFGAIDRNGQKILECIVRTGQNILISGSTGSGKTTLLNGICGFIPPHDVVVTVEDVREISVPCKLWVSLETKRALDSEDREVTLRDLIHTSLRMNPRWVIVGEVRGKEALELVRAFNTGHYGAGTIHANSAYDALDALELLVLQSGLDIPSRAVKGLVSRAIRIVVHMDVLPDHSRVLSEIIEVEGLAYDREADSHIYKTRTLYQYEFDRFNEKDIAVGRFVVKDPPTWIDKINQIQNFQTPDFWRS